MGGSSYKTVTIDEIEIPIEKLEKGMIINKDILANNGNVLVREGYVIKNQYAIDKVQDLLKRYNMDFIAIKHEKMEERQVEEFYHLPDDMPKHEKKLQEIIYSDVLDISDKKEADSIDKLIPDVKKNISEKMLLLFNGEKPSEVASIRDDIQKSMEIINTSVNIPQLLEKIKKVDSSLYIYNYSTALTAYMIGKWIGLDQNKREELYISAMLSNIGLLNLPEDKRFRDQWEEDINEYYQHVIHSHRVLTKCSFMTKNMLLAVLHHHEKYDGSGYPRKISGKKIPLLSRIIYIADLYTFYTIRKEYNSLYTINLINENHIYEVDMEIFFTLSQRMFDYFTGQRFQTKASLPTEGRIITFDKGTGNMIFDQSNINVYVQQEDDGITCIPLNTFCSGDIEFT